MQDHPKMPHCDQYVLHAPGECKYCDMYPEAQQKRVADKINFTGHHEHGKTVCPSEERRSIKIIHNWYGNAPTK